MTGSQFERWLCRVFKALGYWALNISKDARGAQPFDILAIRGDKVFAVDCKVCGSNKFQLRRIEDNQWTAFETVSKKTFATVGIMAWYNGQVYFYPYDELKFDRVVLDQKIVPLDEYHIWLGREQVNKMNLERDVCKR